MPGRLNVALLVQGISGKLDSVQLTVKDALPCKGGPVNTPNREAEGETWKHQRDLHVTPDLL